MSYQISFQQKKGYLSVVVYGERTLELVEHLVFEISSRAMAENTYRLLIDVRGLQGWLKILDSYHIVTREFPKIRSSRINRVALLDREFNEGKGWVFFETIAKNRGFSLSIFTDRKRAIAWLLE